MPWYVTCKIKGCEAIQEVPTADVQAKPWKCPQCAARCNVPLAARKVGAAKSARIRKEKAARRFDGMTLKEAYLKGYQVGYNAGSRWRERKAA